MQDIYWEVALALTSGFFYDLIDTNWTEEGQDEKMEWKAQQLFDAGAPWGDFGTRRRRHFEAQERVVRIGKSTLIHRHQQRVSGDDPWR